MTYHDCENYHDCHILQTFGTNKQAVVDQILSNTCNCIIPMVAMSWRVAALIISVIGALLNKEISTKVQILMVLHNHDCGEVDISITIMKTTSRLLQSQKSPSPTMFTSFNKLFLRFDKILSVLW